MYFHHPDDREVKDLFAGVTARTFWGEKMLIAIVDLAPNSVVPLHQHPHEQVGIVLAGEATFTVAGETRVLKPGDVYVIPGNVEHTVAMGSEGARCMDVFSPVREEYKY